MGKRKNMSVIQGMKSISTRKTLISENIKEKKREKFLEGTYGKKRFSGFCLIFI